MIFRKPTVLTFRSIVAAVTEIDLTKLSLVTLPTAAERLWTSHAESTIAA